MRKNLALITLLSLAGIISAEAALTWRPGEGWTDESGASEVSASSSRDQLQLAKKLEADGDLNNAFKAYSGLVRRWPLSFYAPEAQYKVGLLHEQRGDFWQSFKSYQKMVEKYPNSEFFDKALERQFALGNLFLAGEPQKLWKIPIGPSMDKTVEIFEQVIKNAPYGRYAPEAQFRIGLAREKQKKYGDAVAAYNTIIDKYPGNDIVDDAQYQIGYAWFRASSEPDYDQSAAEKSIQAFEDFLVRYPNSEKSDQAQENMKFLKTRQTQGSYNIARFYEGQQNYKAAYIYYNEVVRQNPESNQAQLAKKKIDELRPRVEKELNLPPVASNTATPNTQPKIQ